MELPLFAVSWGLHLLFRSIAMLAFGGSSSPHSLHLYPDSEAGSTARAGRAKPFSRPSSFRRQRLVPESEWPSPALLQLGRSHSIRRRVPRRGECHAMCRPERRHTVRCHRRPTGGQPSLRWPMAPPHGTTASPRRASRKLRVRTCEYHEQPPSPHTPHSGVRMFALQRAVVRARVCTVSQGGGPSAT
ncbi:hypothetical protein C8Q78DRAFT_776263 [Trametes maxima]|nr:hypothetical protein C8Q78DRAFT_776263 [Trametes maxima]